MMIARCSAVLAVVCALLAALGAVGPAAAAWTPLLTLGGAQLLSDPSCAADAPGKAVCVAMGTNAEPIANRFDGTKWTGWVALPGTITSAPSCFAIDLLAVWCGVRNSNDQLVTYDFNGTLWSGPFVIGGRLADAPSCVSLNLVTALCVARWAGGPESDYGLFGALFKGKRTVGLTGTWSILRTATGDVTGKYPPASPIHCATNTKPFGDAYCVWYTAGTPTASAAAVVRRFIGQSSTWAPTIGVIDQTESEPPLTTLACAPYSTNVITFATAPNINDPPHKSDDSMICYGIGRNGFGYFTTNHAEDARDNSDSDVWATWANPSFTLSQLHVGQFGCAPAFLTAPAKSTASSPIGRNACVVAGTDTGGLMAYGLTGYPFTIETSVYESIYPLANDPVESFLGSGKSSAPPQFIGTPTCFALDPTRASNGVMCVARDAANVASSTTGP